MKNLIIIISIFFSLSNSILFSSTDVDSFKKVEIKIQKKTEIDNRYIKSLKFSGFKNIKKLNDNIVIKKILLTTFQKGPRKVSLYFKIIFLCELKTQISGLIKHLKKSFKKFT